MGCSNMFNKQETILRLCSVECNRLCTVTFIPVTNVQHIKFGFDRDQKTYLYMLFDSIELQMQ